ncbi:MaoC family dehydratase, partial [Deltaproteobacteria bacterium]|nr:MaoC family dehydratase [Deltaproteobacteria bacterium]
MEKKVRRNIFINFKRFFLITFLILITVSWAQAQRVSNDFLTLYPGAYTAKEKALVEKYYADNKLIEDRGEIDIQALINGTLPKDTPGVGPVIEVTEEWIRYNNEKYDPENPVLNNAEYARKLGYQDIIAFPTFGAHDDTYIAAYPPQGRDTLLVDDLNHSITNYRPVYPGDTLYLVVNARHITELTPLEGSIYRSLDIRNEGSIYNQKGEKVNDVMFSVTENVKVYKDDKRPENASFSNVWEAPNWMSRPAHYYTDEDWEFIKDIWSKEKRQGAEPLYWEDVKIGDEPTWTLDGPIEASVSPTPS